MRIKLQGGPEVVSYYRIVEKSYQVVIKPANEIRFLCQIKVSIEHYNIIHCC